MSNAPFATDTLTSREHPRILVCIDFSEDSRAALLWACRYASCFDSQLILLHVVHDPANSPGFYSTAKTGKLETLQSSAENMMAEFMEETLRRHPDASMIERAERQFIPGLPPSRIVEVSELLDADLIVVGNRGISGIPHMLLGSVAERVVKLATRPVVVVKADHKGELTEEELKRQKKRIKKERKWLKKMLKLKREDRNNG